MNMYRKTILLMVVTLFMSMAVFAQLDPGGLGQGTGSGGGGGDVEDVTGGGGTTGGNQGTEVPIDKEIIVLFAAGVIILGVKLYQIKKEQNVRDLQF